ncbi:MAG: hypothetical protein ACPG77_14185 [Nannocystaceae bacterium]
MPLLVAVLSSCMSEKQEPRPQQAAVGEPIASITTHTARYDPLTPTKKHFLISNETRHDLFFESIHERGGGYFGVGSEQNYTLLATANATHAYLVDIDAQVLEYHRLLATLVRTSRTPEQLLTRFSAGAAPETIKLIDAAEQGPDRGTFTRQVGLYDSIRTDIEVHLRSVATRSHPTWLSSPVLYQRVRSLFLKGRIQILPGDLQGRATLQTIAEEAQRRGTPIRTLYLSNAEEYVDKRALFVANLRALQHPSGGLVLRTLYREDWEAADGLWSYQVHTLEDLVMCLSNEPTSPWHRVLDGAVGEGCVLEHLPGRSLTSIGVAPQAP